MITNAYVENINTEVRIYKGGLMGRSLIIIFAAVPLSLLAGIWMYFENGTIWGIRGGILTFIFLAVLAGLNLFFQKKISLLDVILPVPVAAIWSLALSFFSFGATVFSAPTCIGAAFCLSFCLWKFREAENTNWLILPVVCFLYEMLPVNIPGPFDDYFAFGGAVTSVVILSIIGPQVKALPEILGVKSNDSQQFPENIKKIN
ncbi:MAG: hypothetical protein HQM10_07720 [Candidatus Riflebacteria bacterium]|nr:hypothetical protein [Candidatus Riflebacteria bacterium]